MQASNLIAADLYIVNIDYDPEEGYIPYLDEKAMRDFLDEQKNAKGKPVIDYAFVTASNKSILNAVIGSDEDFGALAPACDYTMLNPFIMGVPKNYLKVIYTD